MKNLVRVIRLAFGYRRCLVASVVCSLMVGALWGGNIATLYPLVEIVFRGDSFHDWSDEQVASRERSCREIEAAIAILERENVAANAALAHDIQMRRAQLASAQQAIIHARQRQKLIKQYLPQDPFMGLVLAVAASLAATVLKSLFLMANVILVAHVQQATLLDLQNQLFHKTLNMELAAFGEHRTSDLLARFTYDMRILETGLGNLLGQAVREPLKMFACLIGAALISWQLLLLSLLVTPLGLLVMRRLSATMKRSHGRRMDIMAAFYARLSEAFNGIKVVQAFTMEGQERKRFSDAGREYRSLVLRFTAYFSLFKPVSETMGMMVVSLAVLIGAYLVLNQQTHLWGLRISNEPLSAGALMVFFGMLAGVADPARKMSDIYAAVLAGVAAADRIYGVMDRSPRITNPPQPKPVPRPYRELVLDHVHFHYRPGEPVLRDVNLRIGFGESIALVGPNGCGKSTLVNLIPRFFDPVQGSVRFDDVDLRDVDLRDLRRQIGLVAQETLLFDDTILNNIRYGTPDATDEQVIEAAQKAHAHLFITRQLEAGYQTVVGPGGGRLSGGQRKRIALARAILRDPAILILDEATSEIDVESERLIHQVLAEFRRGRTALVVSHRPSTLELADRVVLMRAGRIVDSAPQEELLAKYDWYRGLHQAKMHDAA